MASRAYTASDVARIACYAVNAGVAPEAIIKEINKRKCLCVEECGKDKNERVSVPTLLKDEALGQKMYEEMVELQQWPQITKELTPFYWDLGGLLDGEGVPNFRPWYRDGKQSYSDALTNEWSWDGSRSFLRYIVVAARAARGGVVQAKQAEPQEGELEGALKSLFSLVAFLVLLIPAVRGISIAVRAIAAAARAFGVGARATAAAEKVLTLETQVQKSIDEAVKAREFIAKLKRDVFRPSTEPVI